MSKKAIFLSTDNVAQMVKRIFIAHQNDGGGQAVRYFNEQIAGIMNKWPRLDYVDSYESLTNDIESEMTQINNDFFKNTVDQFLPGAGFKKIKKLETVDDYLNYDIQREPDVTVNAETYRDENRIPVNRKPILRQYDRSSEGIRGRSLSQKTKEIPGMDELWEHVNKPVVPMDRNDVRYYGQSTDDSSSLLMNTSWV